MVLGSGTWVRVSRLEARELQYAPEFNGVSENAGWKSDCPIICSGWLMVINFDPGLRTIVEMIGRTSAFPERDNRFFGHSAKGVTHYLGSTFVS